MNRFKTLLLASAMVVPMGAIGAQAADITPDMPSEVETSQLGLYLRGDLGWSFLNMSGASDDSNWLAGGGIGYQYTDNLRMDVTADWSGDYNIAPGADISTTAVMANAYFDWANDTAFTPYVGAGVGWGWVNGKGTALDDSGLALGLAAGVAVDLTNNLAIDVGYRFRDFEVSGPNPTEHQAVAGIRFKF